MSRHGEYFILKQQTKDTVRIFSEKAEKIANTKQEIFQTILPSLSDNYYNTPAVQLTMQILKLHNYRK